MEELQHQQLRPFHLAIPMTDINATRKFYVEVLHCTVGREDEHWIDFNFFGHQLSAHLVTAAGEKVPVNNVDGESVPVRHFGIILEWATWHVLAERLKAIPVEFIIKPSIRFKGQAGEQATMFIKDPAGNALEFKAFQAVENIFKK